MRAPGTMPAGRHRGRELRGHVARPAQERDACCNVASIARAYFRLMVEAAQPAGGDGRRVPGRR